MATFGIDIGTSSIKVVQLERDGKVWRLVSAGIAPTPPPGMLGQSDRDLTSVAQVIKKLLLDAKISEKNAAVSLPESNVYTRLVSFPLLTEQEIASAVGWQIEGYIPISKKNAVYDHQIVYKDEKGVEVLIIAVPKAVVVKYMKVLQFSGLNPIAIETELLALSRAIAPLDKRSLIVDFGAVSTDVAVIVGGQLMFSRSISTAGQALTRAVAQGIGVESRQAEEYKKTYGLVPEKLEGKVAAALDPVVRVVVDEIKRALGFWREDHPDLVVEEVLVSGGTVGLPSLVSLLTQALGIEVTVGNPFANVKLDPSTQKSINPFSPLYAIAVGLAKREG